MEFIPTVLSILILSDIATINSVCASPNSIINTNNSETMSRVFVQFKSGHKTEVAKTLGIGSAFSNNVHYDFKKLESFVVSVPTSKLEDLQKDPNILSIKDNPPCVLIPITKDSIKLSLWRLQAQEVPYGVNMVKALDVWDADRNGIVNSGAPTGASCKICIIDSGFLTSHEDLQGLSVSGYNGNKNLSWNKDGDGHGTHVAGTIAAMNINRGIVGGTLGTVDLYIVQGFGNEGT